MIIYYSAPPCQRPGGGCLVKHVYSKLYKSHDLSATTSSLPSPSPSLSTLRFRDPHFPLPLSARVFWASILHCSRCTTFDLFISGSFELIDDVSWICHHRSYTTRRLWNLRSLWDWSFRFGWIWGACVVLQLVVFSGWALAN